MNPQGRAACICHELDLLIFGPVDIEPMDQDDDDLHGLGLSMEEF